MKFSEDQILERVRSIISETLRISPEEVRRDSALGRDLGADSMDFIDIIFRMESEFKIRFYPAGIIDKLSEVFSAGGLLQEGRLTDFGARILRQRLPDISPSALEPGALLGSIEAFYTPATWARVVRELLEARPEACPSCGAQDLKVLSPVLLQCQECKGELSCPNQEELIEAWARQPSKCSSDA